jgi:RNA polymerase sigma-70 factor, ECF subfamily
LEGRILATDTEYSVWVERMDERLVRDALGGAPAAFGELAARCERSAMRVGMAILGRREDAGDAVQNAFCRAYQNLRQFRGDAAFKTWFTSIVVNECRAIVRSGRRRRRVFLDAPTRGEGAAARELPDPALNPEQLIGQADCNYWVRVHAGRLPGLLRRVVWLVDFDELPMEEAAQQLGITVAAAKARLRRGRQEMRARLERRFAPPPPAVVQ